MKSVKKDLNYDSLRNYINIHIHARYIFFKNDKIGNLWYNEKDKVDRSWLAVYISIHDKLIK